MMMMMMMTTLAINLWTLLMMLSSTGEAIVSAATFTDLERLPTEESDYCEHESFSVRCSYDEVIVMKSAVYGRMHLGRCIKLDMGHLGCQADVLDLADQRCSGRRSCDIRIPDPAFESTRPCLELKSFLKANYYCMKVVTAESRDCRRSAHIPRLPINSGRLASLTTLESGWCGTPDSPWIVDVLPGQRINVTLMDFGLQAGLVRLSGLTSGGPPTRTATAARGRDSSPQLGTASTEPCRARYATLRERGQGRRTVEVCAGTGGRLRHVYVSTGNTLEVVMDVRRDNPDHFVLVYEAVGCPDPILTSDMWLRRDADVINIGCRATNDRWRQNCVGRVWTGDVIGNCSNNGVDKITTGELRTRSDQRLTPTSVAVIVVICVSSSILGLAAVLLALFYFRRKQFRRHHTAAAAAAAAGDDSCDQPVSPKTLVSEIPEDELYLRPTLNGFHGNTSSTSQLPHHLGDDSCSCCRGNSCQGDGVAQCGECCCHGDGTMKCGRSVRCAGGGGGQGATGYRRATSCIEENKYTHIWEMPLPIPGE